MKTGIRLFFVLVILALLLPACGPAEPPQLGDFTWIDRDGDGIQDAGEQGLEGVQVSLFTSAGDLVDQTESDDTGFYGFAGLAAGQYYLEFTPPERYYDVYTEMDTLVVFQVTLKDQGTDDAADSDVNADTRRSDVFSFDPSAANLTLDVGFISQQQVATSTPEPSPTPESPDGGGGNGGGQNGGGDGEKKVIETGPTDDSYVITSAPDENYGSQETFYLWGQNSYVYLRFPLIGIPSGTHIPYANLHLKIHSNSTAAGTKIVVGLVSPGYTWDQNTLNWTNSPSPDPNYTNLIEAILVPYNGEGSEDVLDVTPLVQHAVDQGYIQVEFILMTFEMTDEHSQEWYSSESGKGPVLEVDP